MRKLKLDPEALVVETFLAGESQHPDARTVRAYDSADPVQATYTGDCYTCQAPGCEETQPPGVNCGNWTRDWKYDNCQQLSMYAEASCAAPFGSCPAHTPCCGSL